MKYLLTNAKVYTDGGFSETDVLVDRGVVVALGENLQCDEATILNFSGCVIFPGFVDVHVHFREPGFSYKETIETGSKAAARGGYTAVCTMPNLKPVPDSVQHLKEQLDIIHKDAVIKVYPYGSITVGQMGEEMSDLEGMAKDVIAFSDDGRGVQSREMMKDAMLRSKALGKMIVAHCEDNSLLRGGYIHDGEYAKAHNHKGICSESEYGPIIRDIELVEETGCSYHVCHVSAKESIDAIRQAKKRGVDITCETGPHYLVLDDSCLQEDGRFKMNPPLRDKSDRQALIEGILDGTVDVIATDHAPHSAEEKSKGLEGSAMGITGIETAFSILYTKLVKPGVITLQKLVELLNTNARKRFGIGSEIKVGESADLTVFDLDCEYTINPEEFISKGKATPFKGEKVFGKCRLTMCNGKIVWQDDNE
ncbi:MAG: dihydroorotase [Ruminococcaceae bacterium]|nr:dihydroorotase [Oscillospiraceae bacterium]